MAQRYNELLENTNFPGTDERIRAVRASHLRPSFLLATANSCFGLSKRVVCSEEKGTTVGIKRESAAVNLPVPMAIVVKDDAR